MERTANYNQIYARGVFFSEILSSEKMKGYLICVLLLCLSLSVCGQSPVANSQQNMNLRE